MSKRTLRNGTIVHKRKGDAVPFVPQIRTNPGVDTLELLRPERAVERLEAEHAAITREVEGLQVANAHITYERDNLLGILRHVEWHGTSYRNGEEENVCPFCYRLEREGHRKHCDLGNVLTSHTALASTTDTKETTDGH